MPLFNDRLEKEIDDWLHVMKYDEVPHTYHSPYMAQVAEKLSILKMTKEERALYSYYQKQIHIDRDELHAAEARGEAKCKAEGIERGMKDGEAKQKMIVARKLLAQNIEASVISAVTGLSQQEVEKLKS